MIQGGHQSLASNYQVINLDILWILSMVNTKIIIRFQKIN